MLPRAALRATLRPAIRTQLLSNTIRHASAKRPPPPPPPPSSSPPRRPASPATLASKRPPPPPPPPPPKSHQSSVSSTKRQTSPGTALPKDQTWKAEDAIKLGGGGAVKGGSSPVGGERPAEIPHHSPTTTKTSSQEPLAHKSDVDEPTPGSARDVAQEKMAESENMPETAQHEHQNQQHQPPLPDLRQGIPSTFDFEYGGKQQSSSSSSSSSSYQDSQEDKLDLTSEGGRKGEREEREYDNKQYETSVDRRRAQMSNYLYATILLAALTTGFYLSRPFSELDDIPSILESDEAQGWAPSKLLARVRARMGSQVNYYTEPSFPKLLPDVPESQRPPYTLVLSLEDLMIHTTWDTKNGYRTAKRPGIDYFIRYLSQYYELVLFTSAPRQMADPIMAKLDPYHFIMWPLGREATKYEKGEYVKDLSYLNRPLNKTLIVDTHAPHVKNQPENAIILPKWTGDKADPHVKDLVALIPFLEYVATMGIEDVRTVMKSFEGTNIPEEFARREALAREKFQQQLAEENKRRPKFSLGSIAGSLGVKGSGSGGGMVLADGQSVAEGLAQGKMLSDQIREQGQKQYEHLEKQIREHGEEWLREEKEEIRKATEAQAKEMKGGALAWFGGGGAGGKKE